MIGLYSHYIPFIETLIEPFKAQRSPILRFQAPMLVEMSRSSGAENFQGPQHAAGSPGQPSEFIDGRSQPPQPYTSDIKRRNPEISSGKSEL